MRKNFFGILVLAIVLLIPLSVQAEEADTINSGIYIGPVDVSGMNAKEAEAAVNENLQDYESSSFTFRVNNNEVEVKGSDLKLSFANTHAVEEALNLGKTGNVVSRYKALKDLEHEPYVFDLKLKADESAVRSIVQDKCTEYDNDPVNAGLKRINSSFTVIPGEDGLTVDVDKSVQTILDFVADTWDGKDTSLDMAVEVAKPKGSAEELGKVTDLLGTFSTNFSSSSSDRSKNLDAGAGHINGNILYPGNTFSTYEVVSPFTQENGYEMAGSYLNGEVVDSMGGGICQVSTTLYNAVLMSELEVKERSPHSMLVSYVQESADAAIAGTYKDFKFVNNTDAPVYIEGYTSGNTITFNIFGQETRPSNRKIEYKNEIVSKGDPPIVLQANGGMGAGSVSAVSSGHKSCVAKLFKYVYVDGKEVSKEQVNTSNYRSSPTTYQVGVATTDPNVYNALVAAIQANDLNSVKAIAAGAAASAEQAAAEQAAAEQAAAEQAAAEQAAADQAAADQAAQNQQPQDPTQQQPQDPTQQQPQDPTQQQPQDPTQQQPQDPTQQQPQDPAQQPPQDPPQEQAPQE